MKLKYGFRKNIERFFPREQLLVVDPVYFGFAVIVQFCEVLRAEGVIEQKP